MATGSTKLPRLLVVTPDFPPAYGGIQLVAHRVTANLRGWSRTLVSIGRPFRSRVDDYQVRRFPPAVGPHPLQMLLLNAHAVVVGLRLRPRAILSLHIVCAPATTLLTKLLRVPVVLYLHADEVVDRPRLARFAIQNAAHVIAVSHHTVDLAVDHGGEPTRIARISPGVDVAVKPERRSEAREPLVVTVSRLRDRYKGHDVMLEAMLRVREHVPEAQWVVVGDGLLRAELEARRDALRLTETVSFRGEVTDADRDALLSDARVFAMPSRLPPGSGGEGFGIVYLEAAVKGTPVVAGRVAGALDAVSDGESGLLIDPEDPAAVAEAIVALLTDDARWNAMSDGARAWAKEFAWPAVASRVDAVLLEVAGER